MVKASKISERKILLELIDEPTKADRLEMDVEETKSLAGNIKEVGLIYPILVRQQGERFQIIAGHRRYLAHVMLGENKIRCVVRDVSDREAALIRASENLGRINLTPLEEAMIYRGLEMVHGFTHDEIGKTFSISPGIVKRRLDLLKMPPQLQQAVHKKYISYGVAEELWRISDIGQLDYYLSFAIEHGVTVQVSRAWVKEWKDSVRRQQADVGEGGPATSPLEQKPIYISCDMCRGPMVLGQEIVMRACPDCGKRIREAFLSLDGQ